MRHLVVTLLSSMVALLFAGGSASAAPLGPMPKISTEANRGLVHKIHGRHCRRLFGRQRHWHGRRGHVHKRWHRHRSCRYVRYYSRPYYPYYSSVYVGIPSYYRIRRFYGRRRFYRGPRFYRGRRGFRRGIRGRRIGFRRGGFRRGGFRGRRGFRGGRFRR
ncbi:MAG: hypothetical protein JXQ99_15640 [Hyphomicrobiaceae bacterium]